MPPRATRSVENSFHRLGYPRVAGVDEVGRGCLAGPVAVGVVVLDPRRPVPGLRDSKLLTPEAREFPPPRLEQPPATPDETPRESPSRHAPSQLELFTDPPEPEPT